MGFLSKIFGSTDAATKGLDMMEKGLDMAWFTPEEKSIAGRKIVEARIGLLKALGPQSKARRLLTYVISGAWCHHVILTTYLYIYAIICDKKNVMLAADKCLEILINVISPMALMAAAFYYAANIVRAQK